MILVSKPPLAAVLLAAIGAAQIGFARVGGMTPWKGGGFGMFATLDHGAYRGVDVVVEAADRSEALKIAPSLEEAAARAATYPADWLLRRLAEGIVARERRYDRPVTRVKLRVWRTEFDSVTLHASERTLRDFVYDGDRAPPEADGSMVCQADGAWRRRARVDLSSRPQNVRPVGCRGLPDRAANRR